uniref:ABC transmembrane type-1 domain-containing protein n=1 Tax=Leersia perrieri TaxID=77586 RepID=A0A0D9V0N7_9ORYZ
MVPERASSAARDANDAEEARDSPAGGFAAEIGDEGIPPNRMKPNLEEIRRCAVAATGRVSVWRMLGFADRLDAALMAVGAVAAVANGMAKPLITFVVGDVIHVFGSASSRDVVADITKYFSHVFLWFSVSFRTAETTVPMAYASPFFQNIQRY